MSDQSHNPNPSHSSSSNHSSNHRVKALLFDIDGTCCDTDVFHRQVFREILQPFNIHCDDEFYNSRISGQSNRNLHSMLVPELSAEEAMRLFEDKEAAFRRISRHSLKPLKGLIEFMQRCRSKGCLIAAVSNAPKLNVEMMLNLFGLSTEGQSLNGPNGTSGVNGSIDTIVLGDDCTHSKPHPEPYQVAMRRLNVHPNECIVFEDSSSGVKAGVAAGCRTVGVLTTKSEKEMIELGCCAAIDDYTRIDVEAFVELKEPFVNKQQTN